MSRKNLLIIYLIILIIFTIGCKERTTSETIHNENEGIKNRINMDVKPIIPDETQEEEPLKIIIKDNRKIIEKNYNPFLNGDGTFMFSEQYDLNGDYYSTYYRVDKEGNILNVYDDKIDNINHQTFNDDGFAIVRLDRESQAPGKSGELEKMNTIMDVNGNYVIDPVYSIEDTQGYGTKVHFYKILKKKYDNYGIIGYEAKVLNSSLETLLEMSHYNENSQSNVWSNVYFTDEFIYYDDKIISTEGYITNINLELEGNEEIRRSHDSIYFIKENEVIIITKDGIYNKFEIFPNMHSISNISKDLYEYYDLDNKSRIYVYKDKEIYTTKSWLTLILQENDKYIFKEEVVKNKYKLIILENGSITSTDEEYYEISSLENHYATREIRDNGKPGFWSIYDSSGNEVVLKEGNIVQMYGHIIARINNNDVVKYLNWPILRKYNKLEIYDKDELRKLFLNNLSKIR